jgi:hypothetical protein
VVLDVEDLVTDQAAVQPGRLRPRRAHGDQVINRPLVDARDTNALGRVWLRHRQVDRNNPAHARQPNRPGHRTPRNFRHPSRRPLKITLAPKVTPFAPRPRRSGVPVIAAEPMSVAEPVRAAGVGGNRPD